LSEPDLVRRFQGLERLYGVEGASRIRQAHVAVIGVGGVGAWSVEALARSGVGCLTLIDLDHIAESNINRQIHALTSTLGQAKVQAMKDRILEIHPSCRVFTVEEFVTPDNWPEVLPSDAPALNAVIDACDQVNTKSALAAWSWSQACDLICVGAAGGKRQAHATRLDDLSVVTHDPLLAQVRYRLRRHYGAPKAPACLHLACVYSQEAVKPADASCEASTDGSLNCHGYGSVVSVTASFGMAASGWVLNRLADGAVPKAKKIRYNSSLRSVASVKAQQ
jgi:tRNA A37 threonylcarbamoyladenosine dehydratase